MISDNKVDLQLDANLITPSKNEVAKNALAKLPKNAEGVPEMIASRLLKEFPQPRNWKIFVTQLAGLYRHH